MIPQWKKNFNEKEIISKLIVNLKNKKFSQGKITNKFEKKISKFLKVRYTVAVPSGSVAILLALLALNLKKNDEVIVSNRAWISVLNATKILGLKVKFVDVEENRPVMCLQKLKKIINNKTKVIIPVHMGGRGCDIVKLKKIISGKKIHIVEDAAQAFGSKFKGKFLGTKTDIGCFSLSVAKTISSGQGGFIVTNNKKFYNKIIKLKNNGLNQIKNIDRWGSLGFNFKFTDILATVAITELKKFRTYKKKLIDIYKLYSKHLKNSNIKLVQANIKIGEIPQYIEVLVKERSKFQKYLMAKNIDVRIFYPSMSKSNLYNDSKNNFNNSELFEKNGLYLPSGPDQGTKNILKVIKVINNYKI